MSRVVSVGRVARAALPLWVLAGAIAAVPVFSQESAPAEKKAENPAAAAPAPRTSSELELAVLGKDKLVRVQIQVDIAGRPATRVWGGTFDWLLARTDRNDDGTLNAEETATLPSPFNLRQVLWGHVIPYSGPGPKLEALDRDHDGKVDRGELIDFYTQTGLGTAIVAAGKAPLTDQLTEALLKRLDANGDGQVAEGEWRGAFETLRTLDANDDEMIGPGELLSKASYPGALPSTLVGAPAATPLRPTASEKVADDEKPVRPSFGPESLNLIVLPRRRQNTDWVGALIARRDANRDGELDRGESGLADVFAKLDEDQSGKLSAAELAAWRNLPADVRWSVRFDHEGKPESAGLAPLAVDAGSVRLELRADGGKLAEDVPAARKRFASQFSEADANRDGLIAVEDTTGRNFADLRTLIEREDRDGDKKLSEKELNGWLDFEAQVASGHVMVSLLDFGSGLFEFLDTDHNGALAGRELRSAWDRLNRGGCIVEGRFQRQALPAYLIGSVSRGRALPTPEKHRAGPAWFLSMDRNADGELSAKEFLGPPADFRKMDRDGDGYLTSDEATAIARPKTEN